MPARATVRELRNQFPKIKRLIEKEGEVIVTDQGTPRYRLSRYSPAKPDAEPTPKDYMARLRSHQPRPISRAAAAALHDLNRGDR